MDARLWDGIVKHLEGLHLHPLQLFDAWKLGLGSGWENVAGHCLVQAGAHLVFDPMLSFDEGASHRLARTALCHDLKKRAEKRPGDFSDEEKKHAEELLELADPSWYMVEEVLVPKFLLRFVQGEGEEGQTPLGAVTLMERLLFIIDDMAREDEIVSFDERIDEVSARNPDPEPEIREQLGRPYWDVEREVGHIILTGLMVELREDGIKVATMNDIPRLINAKMVEKFIG